MQTKDVADVLCGKIFHNKYIWHFLRDDVLSRQMLFSASDNNISVESKDSITRTYGEIYKIIDRLVLI